MIRAASMGAVSLTFADYFLRVCGRVFDKEQTTRIKDTMLRAYRWQYIGSGVQEERFQKILGGMITEAQMQRRLATARAEAASFTDYEYVVVNDEAERFRCVDDLPRHFDVGA